MAEDELTYEGDPALPARGRLARLLAPEDGGARVSGPFLLALAGAAAYAGALALDWATVEVPVPVSSNADTTSNRIVELASGALFRISGAGSAAEVTFTTSDNLTTVQLLGLLFGAGGLVLLTLAGAVLSRPELALRHRLAATGLGLGLLAVVGAGIARLPTLLITASQSASFSLSGGERTVSYQPGIICAGLAIVFPLAAIWLRSWRLAAVTEVPAEEEVEEPAVLAELPVSPAPRRRTPEPYDLTVTPEP